MNALPLLYCTCHLLLLRVVYKKVRAGAGRVAAQTGRYINIGDQRRPQTLHRKLISKFHLTFSPFWENIAITHRGCYPACPVLSDFRGVGGTGLCMWALLKPWPGSGLDITKLCLNTCFVQTLQKNGSIQAGTVSAYTTFHSCTPIHARFRSTGAQSSRPYTARVIVMDNSLVCCFISDRLCGLVVTIPSYRARSPRFDSRHYQIL